jgi:phenylacetate-CoA ligase
MQEGHAMDHSKAHRAVAALRSFYEGDLDELLTRHLRVDLQAAVLEFAVGVVREVPAYRMFLERSAFPVDALRSFADFGRLPPTTKENYHRAFPLNELCRGGRLQVCDFVAVSSGSTGEPSVWPRFVSDEMGTAVRFEQVLADAMNATNRRTLAVVCFALGSWVGGMYTTAACRHIAAKGYPITVVTPGNNVSEILRVVRALGPLFDQIVLLGYPPFLKDVIDAGRADGLDWSRYSVRLVTAGEVFSEQWRSLVCERLGQGDPATCTASLYGTADGGVLANETPLSIRIRRFLDDHPGLARELVGEARLPTLCQYDPLHRYFEVEGDQLLFTGDGGAPLVRYKILDRGGVIDFGRMMTFMGDCGGDPAGNPQALGTVRDLPFVYVFGRSNFALSLYGANVYPENVTIGLERPEIARQVTGKFVMQLTKTRDEDPRLRVVVELAVGTTPDEELVSRVGRSIRADLERVNSEFLHYVPDERRTPIIELLPRGHPDYFPAGVKHRYTRH